MRNIHAAQMALRPLVAVLTTWRRRGLMKASRGGKPIERKLRPMLAMWDHRVRRKDTKAREVRFLEEPRANAAAWAEERRT